MAKNLMTKKSFADHVGVSPAAITKVSAPGKILAAAIVGKRINAAHPVAIAYAEQNAARLAEVSPVEGIDARYEEALEYMRSTGKWSANAIKTGLKVGSSRATAIFTTIKNNGLVPDAGIVPPPPPRPAPKPPKKVPHVRGPAARKETKKREAAELYGDAPPEVPEDLESFADMTLRELIHRFGTDTRFVDWLSALQKIEMITERQIKNATAKGKLISRELVQNGIIDVINSAHLKLMQDGSKNIAAGVASKVAAGYSAAELDAHTSDVISMYLKPIKTRLARAVKDV